MSSSADFIEFLTPGAIEAVEVVENGESIIELHLVEEISAVETGIPVDIELLEIGPSLPGVGGGEGGPADWNTLLNKPTTFAPSQHTSALVTDFTEAAQDAVAAMLANGTGITMSYDDAANTLTVSATGGGSFDAEAVRDAIGVAMVGVGAVTVTVNDAADTITISTTATANSTDAALRDRSTHTGSQAQSTITGLVASLAGKIGIGSSNALTDPTTMSLFSVDVTDDGSSTASWVDRIQMRFNGKLVTWFNEYTELRGLPAKVNTVAARWMTKYNDADADHNLVDAIIEVVHSRQTRTNRWRVMADGSTQQSGRPTWVTDAGVTMQMGYMALPVGEPRPAGTPDNIFILRYTP